MQFQGVQDICIPGQLDPDSCAVDALLAIEHTVFELVQFSSYDFHSRNVDGAHGAEALTAHPSAISPTHVQCKRVS